MKMSRISLHLFQKLLSVSFTPGEQRGTETWPCIRWLLERLRHTTERGSVLELDDIVWYDEDNEGQGQFIYARTRHGLRIGPSKYVIVPTTYHCLVRIFEQRTHWGGSGALLDTWIWSCMVLKSSGKKRQSWTHRVSAFKVHCLNHNHAAPCFLNSWFFRNYSKTCRTRPTTWSR
jgi:hypothetical protein